MPHSPNWPSLPALPLAKYLEAIKPAYVAMEHWCRKAGVSDRAFREWRDGTRPNVDFKTADKVLQSLGILWFDVWNENTVPRRLIEVRLWGYRSAGRKGKRYKQRHMRYLYYTYGPVVGVDHEKLALIKKAFTGCGHEGHLACDACESEWFAEELKQLEMAA